MSLEQGIVPDNRAPGYVNGPIWGPLGNSRVIFQLTAAQGVDWAAGYYAMQVGGMSISVEDQPFQVLWEGGNSSGQTAQLTISTDLVSGVWRTSRRLRLTRSGLPNYSEWGADADAVAWNWNYRTMPSIFNTTGNCRWRPVKEWVDMSEFSQVPTWLVG